MTRQFAKPEFAKSEPAPPHGRYGDGFVIVSVTLLSLALAAWLITRLGLSLWSGMVAALAAYCALLSVHLLVRRALAGSDADGAEAALESEDTPWLKGAPLPAEPTPTRLPFAPAREAAGSPADAPFERTPAATWPDALALPPDPTASHETLVPRRDPFGFRPNQGPHFEATDTSAAGPIEKLHDPDQDADAAPEMNVELIQDLIKKLADELNGTPGRDTDGERKQSLEPANETEAMIGRSVAALEATVRTMRAAPGEAPAAPAAGGAGQGPAQVPAQVPAWWPAAVAGSQAGGPPTLDPQFARIAEAVAAERLQVLLEPIHALAEGRARHYEVSVRLVTADGAALEQCDFARAARGSGLMPRIDAAKMVRAARVAQRLGERGRQGSVLAPVASESLASETFLDFVATQPGSDGRMSLVLSFAQSEVRAFTPGHAAALGTMAAGGFNFALEDVTDLDMDFGSLKAMGFEFVKLDAPVFLDGLPSAAGRVPASDICRYLADFGLSLIVGRIEDDWMNARILGFGVLLGKGTLFGGPKLIRAEALAQPSSAAA